MSAIGWVPTAIPIAAALVLAGWAVVLTALGRGMGRAFRWSGRVLVGLMVAVMVLSLARLGSAAPTANVGVLLGYLVAGIVIPLIGLWWTRTDGTRAGSGVMIIVYLAVAVVVLRIDQVWNGG